MSLLLAYAHNAASDLSPRHMKRLHRNTQLALVQVARRVFWNRRSRPSRPYFAALGKHFSHLSLESPRVWAFACGLAGGLSAGRAPRGGGGAVSSRNGEGQGPGASHGNGTPLRLQGYRRSEGRQRQHELNNKENPNNPKTTLNPKCRRSECMFCLVVYKLPSRFQKIR